MSFLTNILKPKILLIFSILYALFFIYGLWERSPDIDDAWLGEHAYWQAKDGYVHSELMRGVIGQENKLVIHHKLLTLQGALFIKLFGFSLYVLKSISLIYYLVFIGLFYFYTVKQKKLLDFGQFLFALILILVFPFTFKFSFIYRPEIMMMTLGFAGYIILEHYLETGNKKNWHLFVVGLLFGFTMAAHLNGLIFIISGLILLIWNKRLSGLFAYGLGSIIGFSPYFYDMTHLGDFELWRTQFFNNPSIDNLAVVPYWLKPFVNLLNEHMRYFHNVHIIFFSVFLIISILIGFGFLYRNHTNLVRFAFLIALFTGIIAPHKSRQYLLFNFPYIVLLITLIFKNIKEIKPEFLNKTVKWKQSLIIKTFVLFFIIFVFASTFANIKTAIRKVNPGENRKLTEKYAGNNESNMNIVAPMVFIFNEIEYYHRIQGEVCYAEFQKSDPSIKGQGFLDKAASFGADLVMISSYYLPILGVDHYKRGDTVASYKVIDKTSQMIVFKSLEDLSTF